MEVIQSMDALDAKLAECDAAAKISDDALRQVFTTFRMDFSTHSPPDPFSGAYHDFQMAIYERISGRKYSPRNEVSPFDVAAADRRPFPFYTGSCRTIGYFTMGMGFLLHSLKLPAGARIVEFGPGWGNTTIAMAMAGLEVTAVDIEPNFCELLNRRAKRHEVELTVVNADFMWAETVSEPFDAAVFFESFHHCAEHMRLLRALRGAVMPGGHIYFCAEPIVSDFPLPWGMRMDGEALWAIRNNGWMELGYQEGYFREALRRTGWTVTRNALPGLEWASVWDATRIDEAPLVGQAKELSRAVSEPQVRLQDDLVQQTRRADALVEAQTAAATEITRLQTELGRTDDGLHAKIVRLEAGLNETGDDVHTLSDSPSRQSNDYAVEIEGICAALEELQCKFSVSESKYQYVLQRSILERLFFRIDGRPVKLLRQSLFHTSGKPRRLFRRLVLHKDGTPRKAFARWMQDESCLGRPATRPRQRSSIQAGPDAVTTQPQGPPSFQADVNALTPGRAPGHPDLGGVRPQNGD